jgi:hypothetical protein
MNYQMMIKLHEIWNIQSTSSKKDLVFSSFHIFQKYFQIYLNYNYQDRQNFQIPSSFHIKNFSFYRFNYMNNLLYESNRNMDLILEKIKVRK